MDELDRAIEAKREIERRLFSVEGVISVGVGKRGNQHIIRVGVNVPIIEVEDEIPESFRGFPIEIERDEIRIPE